MAMKEVVEQLVAGEPTDVVYGGGTVTTVLTVPVVLPNGKRMVQVIEVLTEPLEQFLEKESTDEQHP